MLPQFSSVQFSSVAQSCPTLCDPMSLSMPGLPVHHQLPELTQTHVHWVSDAIQLSHPLLSPSPPAPNPSQHQGLAYQVFNNEDIQKERSEDKKSGDQLTYQLPSNVNWLARESGLTTYWDSIPVSDPQSPPRLASQGKWNSNRVPSVNKEDLEERMFLPPLKGTEMANPGHCSSG